MASDRPLTSEQQAVVHHPRGKHARVLAVAGSGKTTTMAHRVKHLVQNMEVSPSSICILMFNRLARVQFAKKLEDVGLSAEFRPQVHTFHSYAYSLIGKAIERGWLPGSPQMWVGDLEELVRRTLHKAIANVARAQDLDPETIDVDEVQEAISLWKGALIPPERAGYRGSRLIPLIYAEYEKLRSDAQGLTFDDFVPLAVDILEVDRQHSREFVSRYDHVIVDEYQDVNHGQQRMIELLTDHRADIMVVGDDDQTIYEWRGARPDYILEFGEVFANKAYVDYTLSRSFRFGPVIAQCAQNVIEFNTRRVSKPIVAHHMDLPAEIHVIEDRSNQSFDVSKELAEQVVQLVKETDDPRKIIVLGRMYAQLNSLETAFLARGIPYRVEGRAPFFKRREIQVLLDYVRLALDFDVQVNQRAETLLLSVANMPNRKLSRKYLLSAMRQGNQYGGSTRRVLSWLAENHASPLTNRQRQSAEELLNVLDRLNEILHSTPIPDGGFVMRWLVQTVDFVSHFENYYGKGEASEDRKQTVMLFCDYATVLAKPIPAFLAHIDSLDTTRGVPEDQQIVFTTIFRTKGLEYDYVIIPNCEEGYMPILFGNPNLVYDLKAIVSEPEPSRVIENERRLYYVAVTRARKAVFIGTSNSKKRPMSRFVHEMEYRDSFEVMRPLQKLSAGDVRARQALIEATKIHGANKRVMSSLLKYYLPSIGDTRLAVEVAALGAKVPAKRFEYPGPLSESPIRSQPSAFEHSSEPRWWDD